MKLTHRSLSYPECLSVLIALFLAMGFRVQTSRRIRALVEAVPVWRRPHVLCLYELTACPRRVTNAVLCYLNVTFVLSFFYSFASSSPLFPTCGPCRLTSEKQQRGWNRLTPRCQQTRRRASLRRRRRKSPPPTTKILPCGRRRKMSRSGSILNFWGLKSRKDLYLPYKNHRRRRRQQLQRPKRTLTF